MRSKGNEGATGAAVLGAGRFDVISRNFDGHVFRAFRSWVLAPAQLTFPVVPNFNFDCNFRMDEVFKSVVSISILSCVQPPDTGT